MNEYQNRRLIYTPQNQVTTYTTYGLYGNYPRDEWDLIFADVNGRHSQFVSNGWSVNINSTWL